MHIRFSLLSCIFEHCIVFQSRYRVVLGLSSRILPPISLRMLIKALCLMSPIPAFALTPISCFFLCGLRQREEGWKL